MRIYSSTRKTVAHRVKTTLLKTAKPITIRIPTKEFDYERINRSLMANFIHSLDAANIHILIKLIKTDPFYSSLNLKLYTIHDCFASINPHMNHMEILVRAAFSSLYFEVDYLKTLHNSLISQITSHGGTLHRNKEGCEMVAITTMNGGVKILPVPKLPDFK